MGLPQNSGEKEKVKQIEQIKPSEVKCSGVNQNAS